MVCSEQGGGSHKAEAPVAVVRLPDPFSLTSKLAQHRSRRRGTRRRVANRR